MLTPIPKVTPGQEQRKFNFLIRENDVFKVYWDFVILLFALFNSLTIPMTLSFAEINNDLNDTTWFPVLDQLANVLFLCDIVFQLNTTYYDVDGEEVFRKSKIRINYLTGSFIVDLLSSLPFDYLPVSY